MNYSVKRWRKNDRDSKLIGWFTLCIGDFEVNDCSLVSGPKGDFASLPQRKYQDKEGNDKYAAVVFIPDEKRRWAFSDWCLKELDTLRRVEPEPEDGSGESIPF